MRGGFHDRVQALEVVRGPGILVGMTTRDTDFELRLGRIAHERSSTLARVRASVRQASRIAGGSKSRIAPKTGIRAHFRKGAAGKARPVSASSRRVVVKARFVAHGAGNGAPLRAHVSYLAREGKVAGREPGLERAVDYLQREDTPGNERISFYDRSDVGVDGKAVTAGWAEDSRHFRLIVSAEDGEALGDLKPFIREVMRDLELKLGTRLEWLAVDHWDTDNPHSHVLIRGTRSDGEDLFIPSRLISSGIREKAQEVATRVLGPRLEPDLARERSREISQVGVTSLDRQLAASQDGQGIIVVYRPDLIARLERLERWDLAERGSQGWRIVDGLFGKLRAMEAYNAVEQAVSVHRRPGELLPLLEADRQLGHEGQLVHLGPADELGGGFLAVIETGQGELRYQRFERESDIAVLQDAIPGAIVAFEPNRPAPRPSDHAIAAVAVETGGLYSAELHVEVTPGVARGLAEANIRRLEAMRRVSLVARERDGVFLVGHDHLKRAQMYEQRLVRRYPVSPSVVSYWTLEEQVEALGPTRLDRVLAGEHAPPQGEGAFARQYAAALQQRRLVLVEQGWMHAHERLLSPSALQQMAYNELRATADDLSAEIGKPVSISQNSSVRGVYARQIDLAQGRMALIIGERIGHLVPWRPALERFAGHEVEGLIRGQGLSWGLSWGLAQERSRGIGLGIGMG